MEEPSASDSPSLGKASGPQPPQSQSQGSRALAPRPSDSDSASGSGSGSSSSFSHAGAAGASSASRKRAVQASRGVATMTPDRLARKRANDREAQRAVRERTKAQIRELQDEVLVLKSDQAQLQHVLQENSVLQAENSAMKQAMAQLVHQLDSQSLGKKSSLQHHQHHHEHHHHHHNHQGFQYQSRDERHDQDVSRGSASKLLSSASPGKGDSSKASFYHEHAPDCLGNNGHFNCCNQGNSGLMLPGIEEMTRRPFHDVENGPDSPHGHGSMRHESAMARQREDFERHSFRDHSSMQTVDNHHHSQHHQEKHYNQRRNQNEYPQSYRQAVHYAASRSLVSTARISLDDLPKVSALFQEFEAPSAGMMRALEIFYGSSNGSIGGSGGGGSGGDNGNGNNFNDNDNCRNNGGFSDASMGNNNNGSVETPPDCKDASFYNARRIKLPMPRVPTTCKIDSFLLPLFDMPEYCQPTQIEIAALLAPSAVAHSSLRAKLDPFSAALVDIVSLIESESSESSSSSSSLFQRLPERVAVMYSAFLLISYMVNAKTENFDRVPEFLKPLEDQLERAHAAWIDLVPFPHARIKLVADSGDNGGSAAARGAEGPGSFFFRYFGCLSINWPYPQSDVLLVANGRNAGSRELVINPVFDAHIRRLENWSVRRDFLDTFPEFGHLINLQET
ncbi:hypothetical protein BROUX41_000500 [Berkeleyomyces rouxiae]|uniref:uncharacterized protein n=1 Tax=Berkeleyomyces rouxiae TaxID=2035830 RepID=UPI003B7C4921